MTEWQAYENVFGPLGPVRHDHLMAINTAAIRNAWAGKESEMTTPDAFLPDWTREDEEEAGPYGNDP